jgi:hypothetical protein
MARIFDGWHGFAFGVVLLLACAAGVDYADSARTLELGAQSLSSLLYGARLMLYGVLAGGLLWLAMRLFRGEYGAPEARDTVLWSTCLVTVFISAVRMFD